MKHFFYTFIAVICYVVQPAYATSLWHCLDPEHNDKYSALVIQTTISGAATIYSDGGVSLTSVNFSYQGLSSDKTMHIWKGTFKQNTVYFFRMDGKDEGAFAMKSPNQEEARIWICK